MRSRTLLAAFVLLAAFPARACLNDRDSLAEEAERFPDAVQIITGRFPRNPPLYYQMRVDRESADLKAQPNSLGAYDDVAVALDRLGRDDEALAVMARKLARMRALKTPGDAPNSGDTPWYRYYANTGTFLAHRRIRHPDRHPLNDVKRGRDLIAKSIAVNPNAHFGREKVQLAVMDWMLDPAPEALRAGPLPLGDFIEYLTDKEAEAAGIPGDDIREEWRAGLAGLIALGGAWESPDVFSAVSELFRGSGKREMAAFAGSRVDELLRSGTRPFRPDLPPHAYRMSDSDEDTADWSVDANYARLRKEADAWQTRRTAYMMARLQAGRHPDTDPVFWTDWKDPGPPPLVDKPWYSRSFFNTGAPTSAVLVLAALFAVIFILPLAIAGRRWRRTGFRWDEAALMMALWALLFFMVAASLPTFH
jgi:hypothetical protein